MNELAFCWDEGNYYEAFLTIKLYTSPLTADTRDVAVSGALPKAGWSEGLSKDVYCSLLEEIEKLDGKYVIHMDTLRAIRYALNTLIDEADKIRVKHIVCGGSLRRKIEE